jgi:hypothetical protein
MAQRIESAIGDDWAMIGPTTEVGNVCRELLSRIEGSIFGKRLLKLSRE